MNKHFFVRQGIGHTVRWLQAKTITAAKEEAVKEFNKWAEIELTMVGDLAKTQRRWLKRPNKSWKCIPIN